MIVCIQYYFVLVSGVQHSDWSITYFTKRFPRYFKYPPGTIHSYYHSMDRNP